MSRALNFVILLLLAIPMVASGQDLQQELEEALLGWYEDMNSGDAAAVISRVVPGGYQWGVAFGIVGFLRGTDPPRTVEDWQERFNTGPTYDLRVRMLDAYVVGDAGVTTYYTTGSFTFRNGNGGDANFRASAFWIRQEAEWKVVHLHLSPS